MNTLPIAITIDTTRGQPIFFLGEYLTLKRLQKKKKINIYIEDSFEQGIHHGRKVLQNILISTVLDDS